jgi:hypothetical protein
MGAGASILGPLLLITRGFAAAGDEIDKMSARTGVSAEAISGLAFAAEQGGASAQDLEKGFFGLSRSFFDMQEGSKTAVDSFAAIGISLADLEGLNPEEQMNKIADGLANVEDASVRGAVAQRIFGRAGRQLLPMMAQGAEGLRKMREEAESLGRVMSKEDAAAAAELTDAMNRMKSSLTGVKNQIGAALAPVLSEMIDTLIAASTGVREFIAENRSMFMAVAGGAAAIIAIGAAITGLGLTLTIAGVALGALASAIAFIVSPIGIAIAGVVALGVAIFKYTTWAGDAVQWLADRFGPLVDTVMDAVDSIRESLAGGDITAAWATLMDTLDVLWLDLTNGMRENWDATMDAIGDATTSAVQGIAAAFKWVFDGMRKLIDAYKDYYNDTFANVVEGITALGGVRTIGGRAGDPFADVFGTSIDDALKGAGDFATAVGGVAGQQNEARKRARAEATAAAKKRETELKAELAARGKMARASREARKSLDKPALDVLGQGGDERGGGKVAGAKSRGTFSSAAALFLGTNTTTIAERTANATEETAEATTEMAVQLKRGVPATIGE